MPDAGYPSSRDEAIMCVLENGGGAAELAHLGLTAEDLTGSPIEGFSQIAMAFRCADVGDWWGFRAKIADAEAERPFDYFATDALLAVLLKRPDSSECFGAIKSNFGSDIFASLLSASHAATGMSGAQTVAHFNIPVDSPLYGGAVRYLIDGGEVDLAIQMMLDGLPVGGVLERYGDSVARVLDDPRTPQPQRDAYLTAAIRDQSPQCVLLGFACGARPPSDSSALQALCNLSESMTPADVAALAEAIARIDGWSDSFPRNTGTALGVLMDSERARSSTSERLSRRLSLRS